MNEFVDRARKTGVLIVHAPSGGMSFYEDHLARRRARSAPKAPDLPDGISRGCSQISSEKQGKWPIDQSHGAADK
jgi:hypothetical protein